MRITERLSSYSSTLVCISICLFTIVLSGNAQAELKIQDARGTQTFHHVPQKVVVLNWDLLEQVLALGITPIAAPNLSGYRTWVVKPEAPQSIEDIGTRSEPNLEKIADLKPDVILAASPQKDLLPLLEQIAPVIYLPNFSQQEDAAETAIKHFRTLAKLFSRAEVAEQKLLDIENAISAMRQKIEQYYGPNLSVLVMRFSTPTSLLLPTSNSSTSFVVEKLGLANPIVISPHAWGIKQDRINRLQRLDKSYVLYVLPFPEENKLKSSLLWQAMPFVQAQRVNSVRPVWSYGGAVSLQYTAEAITESLLELVPNS